MGGRGVTLPLQMAHTHSPEKCMYWKKRTERISAAEELDVGWLRRELWVLIL